MSNEKVKFFLQLQGQVYRNDPRQILYNLGFFVWELQICSIFNKLPTGMKEKKNSKCGMRK